MADIEPDKMSSPMFLKSEEMATPLFPKQEQPFCPGISLIMIKVCSLNYVTLNPRRVIIYYLIMIWCGFSP